LYVFNAIEQFLKAKCPQALSIVLTIVKPW